MMKAKELSLDHECFKKIKSSLDYALLLAVKPMKMWCPESQ